MLQSYLGIMVPKSALCQKNLVIGEYGVMDKIDYQEKLWQQKGRKIIEVSEEDSDVEDDGSEGETNIADDNTESYVGQVERIYFDV